MFWNPNFAKKSTKLKGPRNGRESCNGQVHQPPAKPPCLWPHLDDEIFHYPSSVPLFFLSTFSLSFLLPFFFFTFLSYFLHFPSLFFTFPFLFSVPFPLPVLVLSSFHFLSSSSSFPLFLPFFSLFFLFLSSSSDGWMRCVKRRRAKTLHMPDRIFLMGLQAFAFHRERSAKDEVVLTCLLQTPPLWPVRIGFFSPARLGSLDFDKGAIPHFFLLPLLVVPPSPSSPLRPETPYRKLRMQSAPDAVRHAWTSTHARQNVRIYGR